MSAGEGVIENEWMDGWMSLLVKGLFVHLFPYLFDRRNAAMQFQNIKG